MARTRSGEDALLRHLGAAPEFRFPARPTSLGCAELGHAADRAVAEALEQLSLQSPGTSQPASTSGTSGADLKKLVSVAASLGASDLLVCRRRPEGGTEFGSAAELTSGSPVGELEAGGGLLLRHAERADETLNRLAASLSIARAARFEMIVVLGSLAEVEILDGPQRWQAVAFDNGTIARPVGEAPTDLIPGQATVFVGPPRIHAAPSSITLLIAETQFSDRDLHQTLIQRAVCHPLLRVDAPIYVDQELEVYGRRGVTTLVEHIGDELDLLLGSPDVDEAAWWWLLRSTLAPSPLEVLVKAPARVRGRFPGGIGILGRAEGWTEFMAGGKHLAVSDELLGGLATLVGRGVLDWHDDPRWASPARTLLSLGLAEAAPEAE